MFYKFSEEELRSICRNNIEALENWARIIVDMELKKYYGIDYFNSTTEDGNPVIKKSIREKAEEMIQNNSDRFNKKIDTLFLDEIIDILCNRNLYKKHFKKILDISYPDGIEEARTFLKRLVPIRNKLSHTNSFSIREAERCVCYCNDFIEGIKIYFKQIGEERMYNVPNAIKLCDSLGNVFDLNNNTNSQYIELKNESNQKYKFDIGQKYSLWLKLDPSFSEEEYIFKWFVNGRVADDVENESKFTITFEEKHVNQNQLITCIIKSNKSWHKYGNYDQRIFVTFEVLPPMN